MNRNAKETDTNVQEQVKAIRAKSGLSQAAFSARYHIPKRTIEGWEMGVRECPVYVVELLQRVVDEDFAE
jgi:putative transcriptional regulator